MTRGMRCWAPWLALLCATCGDEPPSTSQGEGGATTGATSGLGGGAVGGAGGATAAACTADTAEDHTTETTVVIASAGARYVPACVRIRAGSVVTFESDFATHPLYGGTVVDGVEAPDPASPITPTTQGTTVSFEIASPGTYPYYCDFHSSLDMIGTLFAE